MNSTKSCESPRNHPGEPPLPIPRTTWLGGAMAEAEQEMIPKLKPGVPHVVGKGRGELDKTHLPSPSSPLVWFFSLPFNFYEVVNIWEHMSYVRGVGRGLNVKNVKIYGKGNSGGTGMRGAARAGSGQGSVSEPGGRQRAGEIKKKKLALVGWRKSVSTSYPGERAG